MSDHPLPGIRPDQVLLASCLGDEDTGGGLFSMERDGPRRVDRLSTTGLALADGSIARLLRSRDEPDAAGELLVYDARGVARYYRIDGLTDPHDLVWDGKHFIIASTSTNSLLWLMPSGDIAGQWRAPGTDDAWHLNCLFLKDGELFASAFGKFSEHRGWARQLGSDTGLLMNVTTGRDVLTGLAHPHTPRYHAGHWLICNSAKRELLQLDDTTGEVSRRIELEGYTRGMVIAGDIAYVGESANRSGQLRFDTYAKVVAVSLRDWTVRDRIALPAREVYDLILVDRSLLEGLRRGFRTNPLRVSEMDQYAMFERVGIQPTRLWAIGDPLPEEACRVTIEAVAPTTMSAGETLDVSCSVENIGSAILVSAPPYPVHLSYRWLTVDAADRVPDTEGLRMGLPRSLPPGHPVGTVLQVKAPLIPGEYLLSITLVQEHVRWFDDVDVSNAHRQIVRVVGDNGPDR